MAEEMQWGLLFHEQLNMAPERSGHLGALFMLLLPVGVVAQETPKIEVFGGYSYLQLTEQPRILLKSASLNGWNASVKLNLTPRFGLIVDSGRHYGKRNMTPYTINSLTAPGELLKVEAIPGDARQHTFLLGPKYDCRSVIAYW